MKWGTFSACIIRYVSIVVELLFFVFCVNESVCVFCRVSHSFGDLCLSYSPLHRQKMTLMRFAMLPHVRVLSLFYFYCKFSTKAAAATATMA